MGTNVSRFENLHCGEDHFEHGRGPIMCPSEHEVRAEWSRSSDLCHIVVDDHSIMMTLTLFMALRRAMMMVDA